MKKEYTINDYIKEKIEKEDEIEEIQKEIERLEIERMEKTEKYVEFCESYLKSHSLNVKEDIKNNTQNLED